MNATDFFANKAGLKKGKYVSNQFGLTAGGPDRQRQDVLLRRLRGQPDHVGADLGHDRADRGAAQQRLHRLLGPDLAAERQRRHRHPRPHASSAARSSIRRRPAQLAAGQVDPVTGMTATRAGFVRDAFAGNQIPAGRLERRRAAADDALPRAERRRPEQQLRRSTGSNTDDTHSFDIRVDHNFSNDGSLLRPLQLLEQHTSCGRRPFDGDGDGGGFNEGDEEVRVHGLAASHTHMFSSTLINEARFGLSQEHTNRLQPNGDDTSDLPGRYGILGIPQVDGNGGLPALRPTGLTAARPRRLGGERALQQHGAVQRQPDEGVQVAHLQGRLHVPEHLLRLDPAAVRPRASTTGTAATRRWSTPPTTARRARTSCCTQIPSLVPGGVDFLGGMQRHPRLAVRRRGRLQDLPRRLRAGQLARLEPS